MIVTLLIWLYIAALCFLYGGFVIVLYQRITKENVLSMSFPLIVVFGMIIITSLGTWFSLFMKLGLYANAILILGSVAILKSGSYLPVSFEYDFSWRSVVIVVLGSLLFVILLENSTHVAANVDTALYHAQAIRWIENYRVVPGLGNLHTRLAFNSSWLLLNALFSFSFFGDFSFHVVSGFFVFFSFLYFLQGGMRFLRQEYTLANLLAFLLIPLLLYIQGNEIKSPGTDLPATLFIWLLVIIWLEFIATHRKAGIYFVISVALAVFSITVKLSVLPIILLSVFSVFYLWKAREWRKMRFFLGIAVFIILPWIMRNIMLSGYLVFPFPHFDYFNIDWKIPLDRVESVRRGVIGFSRSLGKDWVNTPDMSLKEWYPLWHENQTRNQRIIFYLAVTTPLGVVYQFLTRRWFIRVHFQAINAYYTLFLMLYTGLAFWFFQAPSFRFGYSFLISLILVAYLPLLLDVLNLPMKQLRTPISILITTTIFIYASFFASHSFSIKNIEEHLIFPAPYSPSIVDACAVGNIKIFCIRRDRLCNYDAFPCVLNVPFNLISRDGTLQGGFRLVE